MQQNKRPRSDELDSSHFAPQKVKEPEFLELHADSYDREGVYNNQTFQLQLTGGQLGRMNSDVHIAFSQIFFMNSRTSVHSWNQYLYVDYNGGGVQTVTVPVGNYSASTLASALQTQLQLVDASFTVTYSATTLKYTIAATNPFLFSAGNQSLYYDIGFTQTFTNTNSQVSSGVVDLSGTKYVQIRSNLNSKHISSNGLQMLTAVPISEPIGTFCIHKAEHLVWQPLDLQLLQSGRVEISLYDDRGLPFHLADNTPVNIIFKLKIY